MNEPEGKKTTIHCYLVFINGENAEFIWSKWGIFPFLWIWQTNFLSKILQTHLWRQQFSWIFWPTFFKLANNKFIFLITSTLGVVYLHLDCSINNENSLALSIIPITNFYIFANVFLDIGQIH